MSHFIRSFLFIAIGLISLGNARAEIVTPDQLADLGYTEPTCICYYNVYGSFSPNVAGVTGAKVSLSRTAKQGIETFTEECKSYEGKYFLDGNYAHNFFACSVEVAKK